MLNLDLKLKKKAATDFVPLFTEMANFFLEYGLSFNDFKSIAQDSFIRAALDIGCNSATSISLKTGIDRRNISISSIDKENFQADLAPDSIMLILKDLRNYVNTSGKDTIAIKNAFNSLEKICKPYKKRLTLPAIIEELSNLDCVKKISKNQLKILSTRRIKANSSDAKIKRAANQSYKLLNTIRKNYSSNDSYQKEIEWSVDSTKINSKNREKLSNELKSLRDKLAPELITLLEKFESNVPENTFDSYSVNIFINTT